MFSQNVVCQEMKKINEQADTVQDIFSNDDPIKCTLSFDIKKFRKNKLEGEYQNATFTYYLNDSISIKNEIKLKARGVSRKKYCQFPPIKLKYKGADFPDPYLNSIKNQKLVTHCKTSDEFEQNLLKEYLIYKFYNTLSEKSFRVKLLLMTYEDTKEKVETITRYAFLIEEPETVAQRNNAFYIDDENLGMRYIEPGCMMTLSMFQFMIGNPDWSITGLHNIKLLKSKNVTELLPYAVPYDFDNTGLVNPPYARPPEQSGLSSVKERKFEGICGTQEIYNDIILKFEDQKETFLSYVDDFELLDMDSKNEIKLYCESFYDMLGSPNFYKNHILPSCKK